MMHRARAVIRVAVTAIVLAVAAVAVGVSLAHSNYDAQQNRAPAARIVIAAVALILAGTDLRVALMPIGHGDRAPRIGLRIGLLTLSVLVLLAWWIVTLSTGRL